VLLGSPTADVHEGANVHAGQTPQSAGQLVHVSVPLHARSPQRGSGVGPSGSAVSHAHAPKAPLAQTCVPEPVGQEHARLSPSVQPVVGPAKPPLSELPEAPHAITPRPPRSTAHPHAAFRIRTTSNYVVCRIPPRCGNAAKFP
jgi:hypothetical protein